MMRPSFLRWTVCVALVGILTGCGDDDGGGTGGSGNTGNTGGTGAGGSATGGQGNEGGGGGPVLVNECTDGTAGCDENATCTDLDEGFECECNEGYEGDGDVCDDVDECTAGTDDCDVNATCTNSDGSFECACNDGYVGDGVVCQDVDECMAMTDDCSDDATCTNEDGSFSCECNSGYSGDGVTCTDDDECTLMTDNCDVNATCGNIDGGFTCTCNPGWSGDGVTCTDDDECTLMTDNCDVNATCGNIDGGFTCTCNAGYHGTGVVCDPDGIDCASAIDIDTVPFSNSNDTTLFSDTYSTTCGAGTSSGNDVVYTFTPPETGRYTFTLNTQAPGPSQIYIATDCADPTTSCVDGSGDLPPTGGSFTATLDSATTYSVIVDGVVPADEGAYTLQVDYGPGETCDTAFPILAVPYADSFDTTGAIDLSSTGGSCGGDGGMDLGAGAPELVYAFTPTQTGTYRLSLTPQNPGPRLLYVVTDCADIGNSCEGSSGDLGMTGGDYDLALTAGTEYFIVVDGAAAAAAGGYTLALDVARDTFFVDQGPGLATAYDRSVSVYDGSVGSMVCITLPVAATGVDVVSSIDSVTIGSDHTWIGDVTWKLVSPSNTVVTLMSRPGFGEPSDNGTGCCGDSSNLSSAFPLTFMDGAADSAEDMGSTIITSENVCEADLICDYSPAPGAGPGVSLADFVGEAADGNWQMCFGDSQNGEVGNIDYVRIDLSTAGL